MRVVGTQASIYLSIHLSIYLSIAQAEVGRSFGAVESKAFATYTTPVLNALAHTQAHANAHAHAPAPAPALTLALTLTLTLAYSPDRHQVLKGAITISKVFPAARAPNLP